jgi:hypothetical protein
LLLVEAQRRKLDNDRVYDGAAQRYADDPKRFYPISGDVFVLRAVRGNQDAQRVVPRAAIRKRRSLSYGYFPLSTPASVRAQQRHGERQIPGDVAMCGAGTYQTSRG